MVSEKPWRIECVARLCFAIVSSLMCGLFLAGLVDRFKWPEEQKDVAIMAVMMTCFHMAAVGWIALFLRGERMTWRQAFFTSVDRRKAVILGVTVGIVATPVLLGVEWLSGNVMVALHLSPQTQEVVDQLQNHTLSLGAKLVYGTAAIIIAPVAEEMIFRGVLYPAIKQRGYPQMALWGTSLLFAASHMNAVTFAPLVALALAHVWLYERCDNLLAPMCSHAAFNAVNFVGIVFAAPLKRLFGF